MLKKQLSVSCFALCDPGLLRPNNEDYWMKARGERAFILADGMGGHRAGEVASHLAVTHLAEQLELMPSDEEEALVFISKAFKQTNQYVWERACTLPDWEGMGTTLTCLILLENEAFFGHVGDSALFYFSKGRIKRLSQEHSKKVVHSGRERHVLTRAIGTQKRIEAQVGSLLVEKGDRFLLSSDGLTFYLTNEEIEQVLSLSLDLRSCVETLFSMAMQRGGGDNITLILVEVGNELS
jgi:PPM family protein phosphatase